jgi:hypothetical protein
MIGADRIIRWSTVSAVAGVAAVAASRPVMHAYELLRAHGEAGCTARLALLAAATRSSLEAKTREFL